MSLHGHHENRLTTGFGSYHCHLSVSKGSPKLTEVIESLLVNQVGFILEDLEVAIDHKSM